jgi:adenylate kinase family enzyme
MEEVYRHIEPSVINVRSGKNEGLQEEIIKNLSTNHGYVNLDVTQLTSYEMERKTAIGQEFIKIVKSDKNIPANLKVKMLNKIIYSGQVSLNKFILTNFPEQIDQAKEFELNCSKIAAIIYPTNQGPTVEISNKELSMFNIDSLF